MPTSSTSTVNGTSSLVSGVDGSGASSNGGAGSAGGGGSGLSAQDMESHLAVLEGLGPPGATRRPTRRVRSIERTWQWVKSRSSVYGEAALAGGLDPASEEEGFGQLGHGGSTSSGLGRLGPPSGDPGPLRPVTMGSSPPRRQSDIDPDERRRRRQGLTPESLRPASTVGSTSLATPRPRPTSRILEPIDTASTYRRPPRPLTTVGESSISPSSENGHILPPRARSTTPLSASSASGPRSGTINMVQPQRLPPSVKNTRPRPMPLVPGSVDVGMPSTTGSSTSIASAASSASSARPRVPVQSITDIVRRHSSAVTLAQETAKDRARQELASRPDLAMRPPPAPEVRRRRPETPGSRTTSVDTTSETDSVVRADFQLAQSAIDHLTPKPSPVAAPIPTPPPGSTPTPPPRGSNVSSPTPDPSPRSTKRVQSPDLNRQRSGTSVNRPSSTSPMPQDDDAQAIGMYLRSPQLNRIMLLPRPYPERPLQVSLADLGKPDGRPVLVFLGLGCVRYLIALYDELARALGLRLICIDRWGLGKTDQVPQDRRGLLDWADVVRKVLDELGVEKFQVLAHSAGAPYALACVLKMERRVRGKIHLLSPWVGGDVEGYKWLKWVPNGVIKSAIAAEWRIESYFMGKAPNAKQPKSPQMATAGLRSTASLDADGRTSRSSFGQDGAQLESGEGFDPFASELYSALPVVAPRLSTASPTPVSAASVSASPAFPQALMQASHAESLSGTTADLLSVVLGRDAKPWGFSYTDIRHPCKIWYGAQDDRVSEKSMRWMERAMDAELCVMPEEGHQLMSSRVVMFDVLDSLAEDMS
ncbi:hypothetical protein Q8F55_001222 [Vanrija albida]|uniref:AB hydrolase-1 domain-containing protein n=1 Tax=Vanrija albida TaxID=181172 RepID=A0ABR3QFE6_9TREE